MDPTIKSGNDGFFNIKLSVQTPLNIGKWFHIEIK